MQLKPIKKPLLWTCFLVLPTLSMSCENFGSPGVVDNPNGADSGACSASEADGDDDGTPDCNDECPNDPNKNVQGVCGCGIPDVDSDGDGVFDCNEEVQYCGPLDESVDTTKEEFENKMCCLCKDCQMPPEERLSFYVDSNQTTCAEFEFDMIDVTPGSEMCHEMQREYRAICCNAKCTPRPVKQEWEPVDPPFRQGEYSACHLCYPRDVPNGQYPMSPSTITAIAYISGNPSCNDLYWMGRTGNIPDAMCYPMQNDLEEPCGCTPPDPQDRPRGDEQWCNICPDGQYPLRPSAYPTEVGFPGNPSCNDLYWMGRTGNISSDMCQKVQEEIQNPCGCLPTE